jgi:hypothetical protein
MFNKQQQIAAQLFKIFYHPVNFKEKKNMSKKSS